LKKWEELLSLIFSKIQLLKISAKLIEKRSPTSFKEGNEFSLLKKGVVRPALD